MFVCLKTEFGSERKLDFNDRVLVGRREIKAGEIPAGLPFELNGELVHRSTEDIARCSRVQKALSNGLRESCPRTAKNVTADIPPETSGFTTGVRAQKGVVELSATTTNEHVRLTWTVDLPGRDRKLWKHVDRAVKMCLTENGAQEHVSGDVKFWLMRTVDFEYFRTAAVTLLGDLGIWVR